MSGAEVFTMEPDQVHRAVEALFGVEAEVERASAALADECESAAATLASGNTAVVPALEIVSSWWCDQRALGFMSLVGNLGEYLAVCAERAVEIDDYNAADFASYADLDRYPGRDSAQASARPDW